MNRILHVFCLLSVVLIPLAGQEPIPARTTPIADTTGSRIVADTLVVEEPDFSHSPSKAIMYALALPGLGQGYNKKYYKIPIVYAAIAGAGYAINFNTGQYRESSINYALEPNDLNERYLRYWRRNLELSYIALIVVYALQILDAYVDAQLYSWDVNDNLSMRVVPSLQQWVVPHRRSGPSLGLTCSIDLRRQ